MQFLSALMLLSVSFIYLWQTGEAYYLSGTSYRMKFKIVCMGKELILDAITKRATVNHFKEHYKIHTSFQIAEHAYKIKQKYKRIIFVYIKVYRHQHLDTFSFDLIMTFLREVQHLKALIDNMVTMLEEWDDRNTRQKRIPRSGGGGENARKDSRVRMRLRTAAHTKQNARRMLNDAKKMHKFLVDLALGGIPKDHLENEIFKTKNKWVEDKDLNNILLKEKNLTLLGL